MNRDSNINQFIPLHFYEVGERLPDDDSYKIVIYKTSLPDKKIDFAIAGYDEFNGKKWETDHLYELDNVIAWASFSPEWVTGIYPGGMGKTMNSAIWIFVFIVILILAASEALIKDEDNDDFDPDDF